MLTVPASDRDIRKEAKSLEAAGKKLAASPKSARKYLRDHGFIRKDGSLTKKYGG